eukprot:gene20917-21657_t
MNGPAAEAGSQASATDRFTALAQGKSGLQTEQCRRRAPALPYQGGKPMRARRLVLLLNRRMRHNMRLLRHMRRRVVLLPDHLLRVGVGIHIVIERPMFLQFLDLGLPFDLGFDLGLPFDLRLERRLLDDRDAVVAALDRSIRTIDRRNDLRIGIDPPVRHAPTTIEALARPASATLGIRIRVDRRVEVLRRAAALTIHERLAVRAALRLVGVGPPIGHARLAVEMRARRAVVRDRLVDALAAHEALAGGGHSIIVDPAIGNALAVVHMLAGRAGRRVRIVGGAAVALLVLADGAGERSLHLDAA